MKHIEGISRDQIMMTDLESLIPSNSECKQRVPGNRYILRQAGYGKIGFCAR